MVDTLFSALGTLLTFQHLSYMLIGVSVGLIMEAIPCLGGSARLSLLIPFLCGMDDVTALAMLIGLVAVIHMSDTFFSVQMGIPGSSASQATVPDEFPWRGRVRPRGPFRRPVSHPKRGGFLAQSC